MAGTYKKYAGKYVNNAVHVATARSHTSSIIQILPSRAHTEVREVDRVMYAYVISFRVETNMLFLLSTR